MSILRQIADRRMNNSQKPELDIKEEKLVPFTFEEKDYYLALRESILIFDKNMSLLYTIEYDMADGINIPLFEKATQIALSVKEEQEAALTKVYVKRNGRFECISFVRKFDATFIFKNLKRVAVRGVESIEEIYMERDGVTIERFDAAKQKQVQPRGLRGLRRNHFEMADTVENMPIVNTLVEAESIIENIVGAKVQDALVKVNPASIDKCIELLQKAKTEI